MSTQPVWDEERGDFMYPAPPTEVLPRYTDDELRSLLDARLKRAREHPEELLTVEESFDRLMASIK
jgi:hypothetical protein